MSERLSEFINQQSAELEEALRNRLPVSNLPTAHRLNEALEYALFPGGKRLRPIITLLGTKLTGTCMKEALQVACAIEFLHTSSLIFDDLPAMDDADKRRGRAALHSAFGEGIALLAALALFNQSYTLLAKTAANNGKAAERLILEATECVGANGMIGGQVADLEIFEDRVQAGDLSGRNLKTTALMRLTTTAGAIAYGAKEADVYALAYYGECLGAAYQICDDILDELGDSAVTGKTVKQDARHRRLTFLAEMGVNQAHRLVVALVEEGKAALTERFGDCQETMLLKDIADSVTSKVKHLEPVMSAAR